MEITTQTENQILKDISAGKYQQQFLVYIRKSTDEPDNQKNSIAYQKAEGIKFCERESLSIAPVTMAGFCVNGIISERHSGFTEDNNITFTKDGRVQFGIDRPKFQRLLQFLSLGLFKGIVCLCWDRVSRNRGDNTILRKLMRKGIEVRFIYAKYDETSAGALHMDIDGMFAEHHSRVTSEKVRLATKNLRENGVVTYRAPIGYLNQGSMTDKPFDPERAPIIERLFKNYATGEWSIADLVRFANHQGLTTVPMRRPRTKIEMLGEEDDTIVIEKLSRPMTVSYIHKILTNPFYIGKTLSTSGNYVQSTSHQPLISEAVFNTVQTMLRKNNVSTHYTEKLDLPMRGLVRCTVCYRVYTPYMKKGILYFGARCVKSCTNPQKSFNITFLHKQIETSIERLSFTKEELIELDATTSTHIVLFEEKRRKETDSNDRRKKRIREDLSYLKSNKLQLLKSGVYTPETMLQEESSLATELVLLQDQETNSDLSMQAVMEDVTKLSELLKIGSVYYKIAQSAEKEHLTRIIFSELSVSENTLQYKCKNGFQALENRFRSVCDPTAWLSEAVATNNFVRENINILEELLGCNTVRGP